MKLFINSVFLIAYIVLVTGLPNSLVERIRASELGSNKVKRAQTAPKERSPSQPEHSGKQLTAIKRGIKQPNIDEENYNEWDQVRRSALNNFDNVPPASLYSGETGGSNEGYDDKSVAEYEKGFHYGINKDQLDEALENAVLKTEIYGDPAAINQYRYYGGGENKKRKRRDLRKLRLKRDVELSPEEVLALLSLYESSRPSQQQYEAPSSGYYRDEDTDETENWLNAPVIPHASDIGPNYMYNSGPTEKWGSFMDAGQRPKRFMVAKKRMDPTRELRHLNGPNRNDFYTLSQLLNNQHEPNVPVYHRLVL